MKSNWSIVTIENPVNLDTFSKNFLLLKKGKIAAIRIPLFYSEQECEHVVKNILDHGVDWYTGKIGNWGRIGFTRQEFHGRENGKAEYFLGVDFSSTRRLQMFHPYTDPPFRLTRLLESYKPCSVATDDEFDNAQYFCGNISVLQSGGGIHVDNAPFDAKGWDVSKVVKHLGSVTYLQMPETGGELRLFNLEWSIEHQRQSGSYRVITEDMTLGVEMIEIKPQIGDLIIFLTQKYHKVMPVGDSTMRITCNSFIGESGDENLLLWS